MKNSIQFSLIVIFLIAMIGCGNRKDEAAINSTNNDPTIELKDDSVSNPKNKRIGKAIFYLENSGSMFGYVKGSTEYVNVVTELAEMPRFAEERTAREFNFVNGGKNIRITPIGEAPKNLKDKLNVKGFDCGDVTKSNLNAMFQLALSKAKNDTISILITDAIYDIGRNDAPLNVLAIEGRETRSRFIERLTEGDLQTIIIKMNSHFEGKYYPVARGVEQLNQVRPYYIWIFGETELLNDYFSEDYVQSLQGYSNMARFLRHSELSIPYQIVTNNKKGSFRFDKQNKNKLINAQPNRSIFQFSFAVNFSSLPFSDDFYNNRENYSFSNENYIVEQIITADNISVPGLKFEPTNIITLKANDNPYGKITLNINNVNPQWITETNIDSEKNIIGDSTHTFGFKFLTDAITEAYDYVNKSKIIIEFNFEILK